MKQTLTPAPLDDKNVMTDWIEQMFDEQSAIRSKNKMMGFINGAAVLASWSDNKLTWNVLDGDGGDAILLLMERYNEQYPANESPFVVEKTMLNYMQIIWKFYWKPENE